MAHVENEVIDDLNEALRGELSAVETYAQAIQRLEDDPGADDLRSIMEDHRTAADVLREHVRSLGGNPSTDSGAWGVWARTVEGTAKLLGDAAALRALKEGEKHGLEEYREIVDDDSVPMSIKQELRSTHIPAQEEHIRILEDLIDETTEH